MSIEIISISQQLVPKYRDQSELDRPQLMILSNDVTTTLAPFPAGITFPGSEYNKSSFIGTPHDYSLNSCMQCHNRHGSSNANLLAQASNFAVCNACHTSGGDVSIPSLSSGISKLALLIPNFSFA